MSSRFDKTQVEIIANFQKQNQKIRNDIFGAFVSKNRLKYDPDLQKIQNDDLREYTDDVDVRRRSYEKPYVMPPRPPDLQPIPNIDPTKIQGGLFSYAMKQAEEKLRREKEAQERYRRWQQQQAELNKPKPPPPKPSWRKTLGLSEDAKITKEELNKIFRDLAKIHHPDVGGSEQKMKEIIEARNQALNSL